MTVSHETADFSKSQALIAFGLVWIVGIALSIISFRLAISGSLWNWGVPSWLITFIVLVGIWHWIWLTPTLHLVRNQQAFYKGLITGGISFSTMQLGVSVVLYFIFRKFTLQ